MMYNDQRFADEGYENMQVCLNGHIINASVFKYPKQNKAFCPDCGEETITMCPECKQLIKGEYQYTNVASFAEDPERPPMFCDGCGKPYPWTERVQAAVRDVLQLSETLNQEEIDDLIANVKNLMVQTPQTNVAILKFKNKLAKVGKEAAKALKDILVEVASETAKKAIWPS